MNSIKQMTSNVDDSKFSTLNVRVFDSLPVVEKICFLDFFGLILHESTRTFISAGDSRAFSDQRTRESTPFRVLIPCQLPNFDLNQNF